jgi:hypothetical protein
LDVRQSERRTSKKRWKSQYCLAKCFAERMDRTLIEVEADSLHRDIALRPQIPDRMGREFAPRLQNNTHETPAPPETIFRYFRHCWRNANRSQCQTPRKRRFAQMPKFGTGFERVIRQICASTETANRISFRLIPGYRPT